MIDKRLRLYLLVMLLSIVLPGRLQALAADAPAAPAQESKAISLKGLLDALKIGGLSSKELVAIVQERGVDFQLTGETEQKLKSAGASAELLAAVNASQRPSALAVNAGNEKAGESVLGNQEVIRMVAAGLPEDIVIKKIHSSRCKFDLSVNALIELKNAGVPPAILNAMVNPDTQLAASAQPLPHGNPPQQVADENDPASPHSPGIYLFLTKNQTRTCIPIAPHTMNVETESTGTIMRKSLMNPFSMPKIPMWAYLPGISSTTLVPSSQAAFYLYFDDQRNSAEAISMGATSNPDSFALLRFSIKDGRRQAVIGVVDGKGVRDDPRTYVPFKSTRIAPGIFKVELNGALPMGEYGFLSYSLNQYDPRSKLPSGLFDFSVIGE